MMITSHLSSYPCQNYAVDVLTKLQLMPLAPPHATCRHHAMRAQALSEARCSTGRVTRLDALNVSHVAASFSSISCIRCPVLGPRPNRVHQLHCACRFDGASGPPRRYAVFVDALARASTDNLEWVKDKALKAAYELLAAKPEQEAQLLTILTNKLGDPNRKVASKAGYLLSCLLTQHPLMGPVVVREVESFLFRCVQCVGIHAACKRGVQKGDADA